MSVDEVSLLRASYLLYSCKESNQRKRAPPPRPAGARIRLVLDGQAKRDLLSRFCLKRPSVAVSPAIPGADPARLEGVREDAPLGPLRVEHCRFRWKQREDCLRLLQRPSSAAPGETEAPRAAVGQDNGAPFLLVTFLCVRKEKSLCPAGAKNE